jgi:hypothetical protein
MVGTKLLGQIGSSFASKGGPSSGTSFSGLGGAFANFGKDGSGTERSNYLSKDTAVDKSFQSTSGGFMNLGSHGAVSGIG